MAGDEAVSRRGIALLAPAREKVKFCLGRYKLELVDVPQIPADGGVEGCSCHSDPLVLRARAISISAGRDGGLRRGPQTQASSDFSQAEGLAYFSIKGAASIACPVLPVPHLSCGECNPACGARGPAAAPFSPRTPL